MCAFAELMILFRRGQSAAQIPGRIKITILGCLGFAYSIWALYGSGAETVFLGFLLVLAGIPIHVWIKSTHPHPNSAASDARRAR